jgi:hypothetical protein
MNGIGSLDFPLYVLFQNAFASSLENKATIGPGAVSPIICLQECTAFHALLTMFDHRVFLPFFNEHCKILYPIENLISFLSLEWRYIKNPNLFVP